MRRGDAFGRLEQKCRAASRLDTQWRDARQRGHFIGPGTRGVDDQWCPQGMRLRAAHGDLEQPLPSRAFDGMNLHAALQAAAALLQAANETLMQGVDVDVCRAGFEQS